MFGKVLAGKDILSLIEKIPTSEDNKPTVDILVSNSGELVLKEGSNPVVTLISMYTYYILIVQYYPVLYHSS